jgi:predicted methyltransferase
MAKYAMHFRSHPSHSPLRQAAILQRFNMRKLILAGVVAALAASGQIYAQATAASVPVISPEIAAAVADTSRPTSDTERDANRKPAETLAFAGLKAGDRIADYAAGSGYFSRLFADVVGPQGHVFSTVPGNLFKFPSVVKETADLEAYAATRPNMTIILASAQDAAKVPEKLDMFWISQNYHDLHDKFMGPVDIAAFNKTVYDALKPGGVYIVLDHVAAKDAPAEVTETLHRIEPSTVRREVEAAGFKLESESTILANPADPHTKGVFDQSIRGHTDQFIYKFRKPL